MLKVEIIVTHCRRHFQKITKKVVQMLIDTGVDVKDMATHCGGISEAAMII